MRYTGAMPMRPVSAHPMHLTALVLHPHGANWPAWSAALTALQVPGVPARPADAAVTRFAEALAPWPNLVLRPMIVQRRTDDLHEAWRLKNLGARMGQHLQRAGVAAGVFLVACPDAEGAAASISDVHATATVGTAACGRWVRSIAEVLAALHRRVPHGFLADHAASGEVAVEMLRASLIDPAWRHALDVFNGALAQARLSADLPAASASASRIPRM